MNILEFVALPQVLMTIAVLIVLLWRISSGFKYGFISEILGIAGIIVGFILFLISADAIAKVLNHSNLHIVSTAIHIAIVVVVYQIIQGVNRAYRKSKEGSSKNDFLILSTLNRLLGAALGVIETGFWVLVIQRIVGYRIDEAIYFTINQIYSCIRGIGML